MNDEGSALSDALQLEHIKFGQLMSDAAKALERKLASQGTLRSGGQLLAVTDIIFTAIEGVVEKVIEYREELAVRLPTLLAPANLLTLQSKIDQYIDGGVNGVEPDTACNGQELAGTLVHPKRPNEEHMR